MTEIYKFMNSAPGDPRTYQAADFADYFGSVLSTGLLHTDNIPGMAVSVATGTLNTVVSAGKAIMDGHLYENTAPLTLNHSLPEATLDRIDRVVLRLDLRNAERNIKLHVKEGVAAASPVAPTLQRDNVIYEISLARVLVRKNTVQLLAGDLVDERLDENLAGLVYSLISIPTSQFQAEWDAFMADIQGSGFATVGSVTTVSDALTAHKADYLKHTGYAVATGSANAYVATLNPALSAYAEGVSLRLKINVANTGASTVNVNGLGAKAIKKSNGNAVGAGNLKVGSVYTFAYDGTSFILQGEGGSGNLQPNQALSGFTFTNDNGEQVGLGDVDLIPANILSGKDIFGVAGSLVLGKKFASGTASTSANGLLTITGISFTPKVVLINFVSGTTHFIRFVNSYYTPTYTSKLIGADGTISTAGSRGSDNIIENVDNGITANGFKSTFPANQTGINWIAYE